MKLRWRKLFLLLIFIFVIFVAIIYFGFLYVLPAFVSSDYFSEKLEKKILERANIVVKYDGLKLTTYPDLSAELYVDKSSAHHINGKENFFEQRNLELKFKPLNIKPYDVKADYFYFNKPVFVKFKPKKEINHKNKPVNISNIPLVNIKKADIVLCDEKTHKMMLIFDNFKVASNDNKFVIDSGIDIKSSHWKNSLDLKSKGMFYFKQGNLIAENLSIKSKLADIIFNGKLIDKKGNYDFNVKADNLSVEILEQAFLSIMKHIKPNEKNFIENFYYFGGIANVDLNFARKSINGIIQTKNLSAKTVKFSIPILLPNVKFIFDGDKVSAKTSGTFGGEAVYTDFITVNMFDDSKRLVSGNVNSSVGSRFAKTYIPDTDIKNKIDLAVKYKVFHQTPEVEYFAKIPVNSNIYYKICDLGLLESDRRVYAKTVKNGDNMYLKTYDYSVVNGDNIKNILTGDGLFIRKNNKFGLEYITGKTNGDAPVSLTGSFGRYVKGGKFSGNLKFNYPKEIITGNFHVKDTRYKSFYVKEASVIADEKIMEINANGDYDKAKFTGYINLENKFDNNITIHNIDLYLEKFIVKKNSNKVKKLEFKIPEKTKDIDWVIERGMIRLDKIKYERLVVESIELVGSLKNKIVNFSMPNINFANGRISAKGIYNIANHSSDTYFDAVNINSNIAADMLLNLQDQVDGTANVRTHLITKNKIEHLDAYTEFSICQGSLKKLGDREFIIKKSKASKRNFKFKLPNIINIDEKQIDNFKADLNGSFEVHDDIINNAKIFSQHKYLSLFAEGKYNMVTQDSEIFIWGKYNKNAQKGIRIFFVPLSLVTKIVFRPEKTKQIYKDVIEQIPPIEATDSQLEIVKVKVTGNPNDNSKIKVELKRLK